MAVPDRRVRHPGKILLEDWLDPCQVSQNALARLMAVPPRRINEIVLGKRSITADTAIRLSDALGMRPQYWLGLQNEYDLDQASMLPHLRDHLKRPAPKRSRAQRRRDAVRFLADE